MYMLRPLPPEPRWVVKKGSKMRAIVAAMLRCLVERRTLEALHQLCGAAQIVQRQAGRLFDVPNLGDEIILVDLLLRHQAFDDLHRVLNVRCGSDRDIHRCIHFVGKASHHAPQ